MACIPDFTVRLEAKVAEQLRAQRVGYLLGAGSSYLNGAGYPLAFEIWDRIKNGITDVARRAEIQAVLDMRGLGIEDALDQLDNGLVFEGPHRHLVTAAIAELFLTIRPTSDVHREFVKRLAQKGDPSIKVFSLNYDPLLERAAEATRVRLSDGFAGHEHAYFDGAMFDERIGRIRGSHKGRQFDETTRTVHLLKLHGSLGWYECAIAGVRRCAFASTIPAATKRLMIPPQRRKASDTMTLPYATLWSAFRGSLGQDSVPLNRLACFGYGFLDEHVNAIIEGALARSDFSVLIFAKVLADSAWNRWSAKTNTVVVTEDRCSIKSEIGPGHADLWNFEKLAYKV